MGIPTTLITDGMGASLFSRGEVDALITASDRVTLDGHVVNKVGTLQLAVAAHAFGVPYHALCHEPDPKSPPRRTCRSSTATATKCCTP
ncbi:hypothetical protein GCM10020366_70270 [Saccharopolyspora gregorii]|uniref:Uncharacterized protein n=1 Tax=Saccharopolyspora gregorii TaxID=33914 RepID=A0ABP6S2X4_9PSEU